MLRGALSAGKMANSETSERHAQHRRIAHAYTRRGFARIETLVCENGASNYVLWRLQVNQAWRRHLAPPVYAGLSELISGRPCGPRRLKGVHVKRRRRQLALPARRVAAP